MVTNATTMTTAFTACARLTLVLTINQMDQNALTDLSANLKSVSFINAVARNTWQSLGHRRKLSKIRKMLLLRK
jgi:cell division FtsZ-interacting protein ZapD